MNVSASQLSRDQTRNPTLVTFLNPLTATTSLSKRLNQALTKEPATRSAAVEGMTLEQLSREKVTWGNAHQGESFDEAWKDSEWVKFMVNRYGQSHKEGHQKFAKFVELKVTELENNQEPVMPRRGTSQRGGYAAPTSKSKAAPKTASAPSTECSWQMAGEEEVDSEPEMYAHPTMGAVVEQGEMMEALQQRVLNMESALSRVINHLEEQNSRNHENELN